MVPHRLGFVYLDPESGPDPQHSLPVDVLSMESPAQGQTVLTKSAKTSGNHFIYRRRCGTVPFKIYR